MLGAIGDTFVLLGILLVLVVRGSPKKERITSQIKKHCND